MSHPAIIVENLSKQYRIGRAQQRHDTLRDALVDGLRRLRPGADHDPETETIWALRDVSFEVQPGEVLGIIGRNGAGKSTLLKILSRITQPTSGRAILNGRVGSLLEVGTGFHAELTGRENIFLSGAILGMRKREIERKFDEIVAFAEIEKFLDTPVKRYSSGMYVRLAFAVAAHLEPEILLVDEVLAVGDAAFQKKCLGKMGDVAKQGRTVLFVSHNMAAINSMCRRTLLISNGKVDRLGDTESTTRHYIQQTLNADHHPIKLGRILKSIEMRDQNNNLTNSIGSGELVRFVLKINVPEKWSNPSIGIGINDDHGNRVTTIGTYFSPEPLKPIEGSREITCEIPSLPLAPGNYSIKVALGQNINAVEEEFDNVMAFSIYPTDFFRTGRLPNITQGKLLIHSKWFESQDGIDNLF